MLTETIPEETITEHFYPITAVEWCELSKNLKPAEIKILIYMRSRDPFGQTFMPIDVLKIAADLGLHEDTVSRILRVLQRHGYLDLVFEHLQGRTKIFDSAAIARSPARSTDRQRDLQIASAIARSPARSTDRQRDQMIALKPLTDGVLDSETVPTDRKNLLDQTIGSPGGEPVEKIAREGIGTDELRSLIRSAGIEPNKTIERSLTRLEKLSGAAAARRAVENALSALAEQTQNVGVTNPGGFLNAALCRGFTANHAKKGSRRARRAAEKLPPPPPPDMTALSHQIDIALLNGDRNFARSRLNQLFDEGKWTFLKELFDLRPDWRFKMDVEGILDRP